MWRRLLYGVLVFSIGVVGCRSTPEEDAVVPSSPAVPSSICVLPGEFTMGSPPAEPGRGPDETAHRVRISRPFRMDATEVTVGEWSALLGGAPEPPKLCGDECPVAQVSWYDVLVYLNARSRRDGLSPCYVLEGCTGEPGTGCPAGQAECRGDFRCDRVDFAGVGCPGWRLPTEAEWEFAARAGGETPFPGGDCISRREAAFDGTVPLAGCPGDEPGTRRVLAGSLPADARGFHELRGNLYEWVWDLHQEFSGESGEDPRGPDVGDQRVVRGGAYAFPMASLRAAHRSKMDPDRRSDMDGFRAVRTAGPSGASSCD